MNVRIKWAIQQYSTTQTWLRNISLQKYIIVVNIPLHFSKYTGTRALQCCGWEIKCASNDKTEPVDYITKTNTALHLDSCVFFNLYIVFMEKKVTLLLFSCIFWSKKTFPTKFQALVQYRITGLAWSLSQKTQGTWHYGQFRHANLPNCIILDCEKESVGRQKLTQAEHAKLPIYQFRSLSHCMVQNKRFDIFEYITSSILETNVHHTEMFSKPSPKKHKMSLT